MSLEGVLPDKPCEICQKKDGITYSTKSGKWVCLSCFQNENPSDILQHTKKEFKNNPKWENEDNSSIDINEDEFDLEF